MNANQMSLEQMAEHIFKQSIIGRPSRISVLSIQSLDCGAVLVIYHVIYQDGRGEARVKCFRIDGGQEWDMIATATTRR